MSIYHYIPALALGLALIAPGPSRAESEAPAELCFVDGEHVDQVKPYYGKHKLGRAVHQPLRGAEIRLASSLIDAEWLQRRLQRALRAERQAPLPACLEGVGQVHIEPDPLSEGLSVKLIARDEADAEQILERALRLL